jgi:ABC-2 type transport system ATP-binding protein
MNRARLIALDRPAALRERMAEPLLEVVTDQGPATARALQEGPGVLEAAMFGRAVHVVVQNADLAQRELPRFLADRGLQPRTITPIRPSLEDVFVSLVRQEGGAVAG